MLRDSFDPSKSYGFLRYGRMSSDLQNPRSPDQQFDSIDQEKRRQGRPWVHLRDYRDDARSGRYMKKRPGLQEMLRDIRTGIIKPDLILVDTLERLGRTHEISALRHELHTQYGILVLTADSGFADPLSVPGRALGFVESIRSTEDGRVKAHNVLRGKKDLIRHKKAWPGGPIPRGLRLQSITKVGTSGSTEVDYNQLIRDPASDWIIERIYLKAAETGWGTTRLAQHFNADSTIPENFKPVSPWTIGYILDNPIYKGELLWNEHATGIVNDTRVLQANPEEEWLRVPDFCEPIVPADVWDRVHDLRQMRRQQIIRGRARVTANGKQMAPPAPGLTLKYLLSGLVRCSHCGASMRPSPSKATNKKTGKVWRRVYYMCPNHLSHACPNAQYLREDLLCETVISRVRSRLFPFPEQDGQVPEWFPSFVEQVRDELQRQAEQQPDESAAWKTEVKELQERVGGWSLSLANPRLDSLLRADIENQYGQTKARIAQLQTLLSQHASKAQRVEQVFDPRVVVERLHRLDEVLAGNNPTQGNIELSYHIERIESFEDGKIVLRTTPLGIFDGAVELLRRPLKDGADVEPTSHQYDAVAQVKPRRRAQLRAEHPELYGNESSSVALDITDPCRFDGLDDCWFWEDALELPESLCWAEKFAAEVARLRATGKTMEQLATHFDKTIPTIRSALRKACVTDEAVRKLPKKMPRRRWREDHAAEVAQLCKTGMSVAELVRHFGKSEPTIRAAIEHATGMDGSAMAPAAEDIEPPTSADGAGK